MNPLALQILQAIVAVGPGVGQAIVALIQAVSGHTPANTREHYDALAELVQKHTAAP